MAFCPNCAHEINPTAPECPKCGALLGEGAALEHPPAKRADRGVHIALGLIHALNAFVVINFLALAGFAHFFAPLVLLIGLVSAVVLVARSYTLAESNRPLEAVLISLGITPLLFALYWLAAFVVEPPR